MPKPMEERQRKIDINTMPDEEADLLQNQLSALISSRINDLILDLNKVLTVYGLSIKMMYDLTEEGNKPAWEHADWYVKQITQFFPEMEFVKKKAKKATKKKKTKTTPKSPSATPKKSKKKQTAKSGKINATK